MKDLKEIIRDLSEYDSATVQNAMILIRGFTSESADYSGPQLKCYHLKDPVVGIAVTGKVTPLYEPKSKIEFMDFYDNIEKSELPVFGVLMDIEKNQGRGAIIGDVMAHMARALGAVGLIGAGSIRDLPGKINADMPVWGTGRVPGHGPFNLIETQTGVEVAGLKINSGDLLIGDTDGI
jgi:regulator of RNase E activity RraA